MVNLNAYREFDYSNIVKYFSDTNIEAQWGPLGKVFRTKFQLSKSEMLEKIKEGCLEAASKKKHQNLVIYFTGFSEYNTGDWYCSDSQVSLNDVISTIRDTETQNEYYIEIICDCSYSG